MSGYEQAKETANKLKSATNEQAAQEKETMLEVKNQLEAIASNADLAKLYSDNAKVGASNLSGETPFLKVHSTGRSRNELADGSEPTDGSFFYKPTGEQFDGITCHILTISRGYKALGMAENGKQAKDVFNQLLGGMIVSKGEYKPFLLYMTGKKLSNMWEFGKQASRYTKAKPFGIPMFALTVKLTTEKVVNTYGKSWVINFEIVKNEDGNPTLVVDAGEFQFLKDSADLSEEMMNSLISATETKKEVLGDTPVREAEEAEFLAGNLEPMPFDK